MNLYENISGPLVWHTGIDVSGRAAHMVKIVQAASILITHVQTNRHTQYTEERSACMLTFGRPAGLALKAKRSS